MHLFLVHHGDAVGPEVDPRRPLSPRGREDVARKAAEAAAHGARPAVIWHSGKLRARQTAEEFRRACNALAEFAAVKDLQPDDPPTRIRDRLRAETRDVLIAGHFPHLPRLWTLLVGGQPTSHRDFPPHGVVAMASENDEEIWREIWRLE